MTTLALSPKRVSSMAPATLGWEVRIIHSDACPCETTTAPVVAWAATEAHGVQPVCVVYDGSRVGLIEDMLWDCVEECTWRAAREVVPR
ncbi:MAG: hypothetical protein ACXVV5_20010 [Solirubrobacteraceae bacterium]